MAAPTSTDSLLNSASHYSPVSTSWELRDLSPGEGRHPHQLRVQPRAATDAYVYFRPPHRHARITRYSNNYIDLGPGESREIVVFDPFHGPGTETGLG